MSINKPIYYPPFLLLLILLINISCSHKTTHAAYSQQIIPTKEWKVVATHYNSSSSNNGLNAGTVITGKNIWAVGYVYADESASIAKSNSAQGDPKQALASAGLQAEIERWDGTSWQMVSSPALTGTSYISLSRVVALSSTNIWAVGGSYTTDYSATRQLIEHWDGAGWHLMKPPALPGVAYSNLFGISALAPNDIWAVGGYARPADHGLHHALIEHWNGAAWQVIAASDTSTLTHSVYEELQGVVALSARDIWAVGVSLTDNYAHRSLIEHWDGRSWRIVPSNDTLASVRSDRTLNAIAARSSKDIWAAGQASDRGPAQSLIKHWDGKSWRDIPGPGSTATKRVADGGNLLDLTILAANDIWAVGSFGSEPRIEHWDGKAWKIVASPTLSVGTSMLSGIVHAADAHQLWAVGSTNELPLAETRTDLC